MAREQVERKSQTIDVGLYIWKNQPIPKCDSCDFADATYKIKTNLWQKEVGIRLCGECLSLLKTKLAKIRIGDL